MRRLLALVLVVFCVSLWGCPGTGGTPDNDSDGMTDNQSDNETPSDNDNDNGSGSGNGNGNDNSTTFTVNLVASNSTPGLNESVALLCLVTPPSAEAVFSFRPAGRRLTIDAESGVATFIISESDLGSELSFTCTATVGDFVSEESNAVVILPTS